MLSIKKANLSLHHCKLGILVLNRYTIVIRKGKVIRLTGDEGRMRSRTSKSSGDGFCSV